MSNSPNSQPHKVPSCRRRPDGDLALAFFGCIAVGLACPVIPCLLFPWRPGMLVPVSVLGGLTGCAWGYPTVIVAAAAVPEQRRAATLCMFAILAIGLWIICWLYRGAMVDV